MVLASIILALAFTCGNCWFYMHHYPFFHHHHHRFPPLFVSNCQDNGDCKMCLVNDVHWCLPCGTYKLCGGSNDGGQNNDKDNNKPANVSKLLTVPFSGGLPVTESSAITTEKEEVYDDKDDEDKKDNKKNKHIHDAKSGLIYGKYKRTIACEKEISEKGTNVNEDRLGSAIFGTSTTPRFDTVLLSKKVFGFRLSSKLLDPLHNDFKKEKSAADHCQEVTNFTEFKVVSTKPRIEYISSSSSVIPQLSAGNDTD